MKDINWKDVPTRNKLITLPTSQMLTDFGKPTLKRLGNRHQEKDDYIVTYDRDYVIAYLARTLRGFSDLELSDVHNLVTEAMQEMKKNYDND